MESVPNFDHRQDAVLRSTAFDRLARLVSLHGEVLPYALLKQGFDTNVQFADCATTNSSKPRTSFLTLNRTVSPSSTMGYRCAGCTTPRSIGSSSECAPTARR